MIPRLQILNRHRFGTLLHKKCLLMKSEISSAGQEVSQTGEDSICVSGYVLAEAGCHWVVQIISIERGGGEKKSAVRQSTGCLEQQLYEG